ncbi:MAG: xanthine dehydrogenase family protein subunit M [Thermodesulfobacteriota bacterium]
MLFELPRFEHVDAKSIKEAVSIISQYGETASLIAGGTDLLALMKDRVSGPQFKIPEMIVNIKTIPEMNRIAYDKETGLSIGAGVTLNSLATSDIINQKFSILSTAAKLVATTQIRNMGTVGGNLCQRPRCMYFRHPGFPCYLKGGRQCYAMAGEHRYYHAIVGYTRCVRTHPSDLAPALVALKAKVVLANIKGERQIPIDEFYGESEGLAENSLKSGEMLTEIQVPNLPAETYQLFLKRRIRHASDFAIVSVAAAGRISGGMCEDICVALGGVAPIPFRAIAIEKIMNGNQFGENLVSQAEAASVEKARPLPKNRYKIDLTKALVKRALWSLWQESGGTTHL